MSARHPTVARALRDLCVSPVGSDEDVAWRLALRWMQHEETGSHYGSYESAAVQRLALALLSGDASRAVRAALWITAPDQAMDAALVEVSA